MDKLEQKCCICIPLDTGMRVLAALTALQLIGSLVTPFIMEGMTYMLIVPFAICSGLMTIMWLCALCGEDDLQKRHRTMISWIVLMLLAKNVYYLILICNGSLLDIMCTESQVDQINETTGATETITVEDCMYGGRGGLIADLTLNVLFDIYFALAIFKWYMIKKGGDFIRAAVEENS